MYTHLEALGEMQRTLHQILIYIKMKYSTQTYQEVREKVNISVQSYRKRLRNGRGETLCAHPPSKAFIQGALREILCERGVPIDKVSSLYFRENVTPDDIQNLIRIIDEQISKNF